MWLVHGVVGTAWQTVFQELSSCSWVPDVHTFLPCVSANFLSLCHCKCLQRHRPLFMVADMCCKSSLPSGDVLKIRILLYTCLYLLSFPALQADPEMFCCGRISGKPTGKERCKGKDLGKDNCAL